MGVTEVIRELRTGKVAYNPHRRVEPVRPVLQATLRWKRRYSTLRRSTATDDLPAFVCGGGQFTVWNNINNPLVLEYRPMGVPLLTNVTGWKAETIFVSGGTL